LVGLLGLGLYTPLLTWLVGRLGFPLW
jgi:hypothetical protein